MRLLTKMVSIMPYKDREKQLEYFRKRNKIISKTEKEKMRCRNKNWTKNKACLICGIKINDRAEKCLSCSVKGKNNGMFGKKLSLEVRKKISKNNSGERNKNWKGGISKISHLIRTCYKYRQWKCDIYTRDMFMCMFCGSTKNIEADHYPITFSDILKQYNIKSKEESVLCEKLWDINNGRTLCRLCHDHTKRGKNERRNNK